ncbi:MAG: TetR/AcrR family transcriptional regulator, partial [Polyangiales bacterium]
MANKLTDQLTPRRKPSQERSRERVERILDATSALLGGRPVDKITTAAIAETAGVPIGSVYQYFPNKLAVLAELARRVMEEVDLKTASLIAEDFGVLPWDQAIDRAIDATIE